MPNKRHRSAKPASATTQGDNLGSNDQAQAGANVDSMGPSRTAQKREAERLQKVGLEFTALAPERLRNMNLPADLLAALLEYQRFPSRGAKRRQIQFIGRLMRKHDTEAIEAELAIVHGQHAQVRYEQNQLELWRDRLLREPDAITNYLNENPTTDRQRLRQLVQRAQQTTKQGRELDTPAAKTQARALFRFLREQRHLDDGPE